MYLYGDPEDIVCVRSFANCLSYLCHLGTFDLNGSYEVEMFPDNYPDITYPTAYCLINIKFSSKNK